LNQRPRAYQARALTN